MCSNICFAFAVAVAIATFQESYTAALPPTVTLTASSPVVLGQGTLLTCSWSDVSSIDTVQYQLETNEPVYDYEPDFINEGYGIFVNATGWSGTDTFYVYINVTEQKHLTSYLCGVSGADGDYVSPILNLAKTETTTEGETTSTMVETTTTTPVETTTTTPIETTTTTTPIEITTTATTTTTEPLEITTATTTTTAPVETTTTATTTTTAPVETTTTATTTTTAPVETSPSISSTPTLTTPTTTTTTTTMTGQDATESMETTTNVDDSKSDKSIGNNVGGSSGFPGWAIALCVLASIAWVVATAYLVYHHVKKDKAQVTPVEP